MSNNNWTLHATPYGTVAATVDSKGSVHISPAFGLVTRYPDIEQLRYVAPLDKLEPHDNTATMEDVDTTGVDNTHNDSDWPVRAALTVNRVEYVNATVTVDAQATEYMRRFHTGPYATAHSSYRAELTTSARAKLEAMALELYPIVATPVRIAEAALKQALYANDAAVEALNKADAAATDAYDALEAARNNLAEAQRLSRTDSTESN